MRKVISVGFVVLAAALLAAATASARGDNPAKIVRGKCTSSSSWKLKVKADDTRVETEFEVDQNRVGRRWSVVLRRNGVVVFRGIRATTAPSGSFEVRKLVAGGGKIVASARALSGGETCNGSASV